MTKIERNIIVGSILGDGNLALYGRSTNAYYREHGCYKQLGYRRWKQDNLQSLDFKLSQEGKLYSPSHPIYTELYHKFYNKGVKSITKESILMLDHPVGLACLYMDDGTLVVDSSGVNKKYLYPRISLYTLSFNQDENEILIEHIYKLFRIRFKLKTHNDGKGYLLELSERNQIFNFLELVEPYVKEIDCMLYKINVSERMINAKKRLELNNRYNEIVIRDQKVEDKSYSENDETIIIRMKQSSKTDKEISIMLSRSYWGIVDKIRRLRKEEKLQ